MKLLKYLFLFAALITAHAQPLTLNDPAMRQPPAAASVTYATLDVSKTHANITLSGGSLTATMSTAAVWYQTMATVGITSGKWYWEMCKDAASTDSSFIVGISTTFHNANHYLGKLNDNTDWGYYSADGKKSRNAAFTAYGNSYVKGDIIGIALDMDAGEIYFYKNGTIQNSGTAAFTGITGTVYPSFTLATPTAIGKVNFGATPLTYTPPSGYNAGVYTP